MAKFVFEAKALNGKLVKGDVVADSEVEARVKIRAQQLLPLKVVPEGDRAKPNFVFNFTSDRVKPKELQVFTRQFSVLVGAGVPIVESLEAMLGGGKSPAMNHALSKVVEDIEQGKRLADSLGHHPNVFDRMYVSLVKAGEEGGVLDEVLQRLASHIEKSVKLRGKVKGAMWYPAAIIVIAVIVIAAILVFVVPNFVEMFENVGKELPALTQLVIKMSDICVQRWYIIIGLLVGVPTGLTMYYDTPEGRKQMDAVLIEIPLFGSLIQKNAIAKFSRTLSTLLTSGVRIVDSLDLAAATSGNYVIETNLANAKESITKGGTLAEPLKKSKYIPDMVAQMISVGEQTGNLDTMLAKVADFYEDEVETTAEALTSLIEPILMIFLGGTIAILVVAMYLPIFDLANAVGG